MRSMRESLPPLGSVRMFGAVVAVLAVSSANARGAEEGVPWCSSIESSWAPPCRTTLDCTPPRAPGEPPPQSMECEYEVPKDCAVVEELDCGEMPTNFDFKSCLALVNICNRISLTAVGDKGVAHEYVRAFDFADGPLDLLPAEMVPTCQGVISNEADAWCTYVSTVYPNASSLEAEVWSQRYWLVKGSRPPEPFPRIARGAHPECRMLDGQIGGRVAANAEGFECAGDAAPPEEHGPSLRLKDVAFSDTNDDGYLDAVATVTWWGGGSASTTRTSTFTRLEPGGPLVNVDELKPGFDCAKAATPSEERICTDPTLARIDGQLSRLYTYLSRGSDQERRALLKREQRAFLRRRDEACGRLDDSSTGEACDALYEARLAELQALAIR